MITIIDSGKLVNTDASPMIPRSAELVGLSTDTKPTEGVGNGWTFIEMDTGKVFFFNAAGEEWLEFAGSGGGGGSGVSNLNLEVTITGDDISGYVATITNYTWKQLRDAFANGANITWEEPIPGEPDSVHVIRVIDVYTNGVDNYEVDIEDGSGYVLSFVTDNENGYPVNNNF